MPSNCKNEINNVKHNYIVSYNNRKQCDVVIWTFLLGYLLLLHPIEA
jgi:hypothetical protein